MKVLLDLMQWVQEKYWFDLLVLHILHISQYAFSFTKIMGFFFFLSIVLWDFSSNVGTAAHHLQLHQLSNLDICLSQVHQAATKNFEKLSYHNTNKFAK